MDQGRDAPCVTATRGEPVHRVARNHALLALAVSAGILAALALAGVL